VSIQPSQRYIIKPGEAFWIGISVSFTFIPTFV
jgi:hypothetical protein